MLKLCKIAVSICLTTPLLVFISTIGHQPSAHAWMKFCNKRSVNLSQGSDYQFTIRAIGIKGGCNTGRLVSWSAKVRLDN